jgi:hypothetical protein
MWAALPLIHCGPRAITGSVCRIGVVQAGRVGTVLLGCALKPIVSLELFFKFSNLIQILQTSKICTRFI